MTNADSGFQRRNRALQERISGLCRAILRISASLDRDIVLREIVDSARTLTGAHGAVLTTIGKAGQPLQFLSSGTTPDEHRQMEEWSEGPRLFAHLGQHRGPFRIEDWPGHLKSLGLSGEAMPSYQSLLATPIRHQGVHVGSLFIGGKAGGREFTDADEEMLVLFASQAAMAIANTRTYRDEHRARARLEALIDTSPVGVVVFDAKTADVVSINIEGRRIVEGLLLEGQTAEQLLDVLTCRFADGREILLGQFPLMHQLLKAETLRNEKIELTVPDGRSVKILVNATPIHAPEGGIESVVVTVQDLAPFEELERMRTELLAVVSHELRLPLTSIKGSTAALLGDSPDMDAAEVRQFSRIIDTQADHMRKLLRDLLDAGRIATGTLAVSPQRSDVGALVDRAKNTFLSGGARHPVLIDIPLDLPRVTVDRQRTVQVLNNLLSNAAQNSPDSSPIRVAAKHDGTHVAISGRDRGRGMAPEELRQLFQRFGDTGDEPSGYRAGLGLAICKGLVEAQGGRISAESGGEGQGTQVTFTVPVAEEVLAASAVIHLARDRRSARRPGRRSEHILVVDDDPQTLAYARDVLARAGYSARVTGDHRELSQLIGAEKPDLILLDLVFPGTDGIELMKSVPELGDRPVVFISAYGRDETIARALDAGAADYIVKPFSATELTARVRAALRSRARPKPFRLGELAIDYDRRRVTLAGEPLELTATEYDVLRVLSTSAGRVSTYRSLVRRAWSRHDGAVDPKRVHAVIKGLRRKLGEGGARPRYILNERGVGYRMPEGAE